MLSLCFQECQWKIWENCEKIARVFSKTEVIKCPRNFHMHRFKKLCSGAELSLLRCTACSGADFFLIQAQKIGGVWSTDRNFEEFSPEKWVMSCIFWIFTTCMHFKLARHSTGACLTSIGVKWFENKKRRSLKPQIFKMERPKLRSGHLPWTSRNFPEVVSCKEGRILRSDKTS